MSFEGLLIVRDLFDHSASSGAVEFSGSGAEAASGGDEIVLASAGNSVIECADDAVGQCDVPEPDMAVKLDAGEFKAYLSALETDVDEAIAAAQSLCAALQGVPGGSALCEKLDDLIANLESVKDDIASAQKYGVSGPDRMDVAQDLYNKASTYQSRGIQSLRSLANAAKDFARRPGNA